MKQETRDLISNIEFMARNILECESRQGNKASSTTFVLPCRPHNDLKRLRGIAMDPEYQKELQMKNKADLELMEVSVQELILIKKKKKKKHASA